MYRVFTFESIVSYRIVRSNLPTDGPTQRLVQALRKRKLLFALSENLRLTEMRNVIHG